MELSRGYAHPVFTASVEWVRTGARPASIDYAGPASIDYVGPASIDYVGPASIDYVGPAAAEKQQSCNHGRSFRPNFVLFLSRACCAATASQIRPALVEHNDCGYWDCTELYSTRHPAAWADNPRFLDLRTFFWKGAPSALSKARRSVRIVRGCMRVPSACTYCC